MNIPSRGDDLYTSKLLSIEDTARIMGGITTREVYKRIADGDFKSIHLGRRHLVITASLDAYIERKLTEQNGASSKNEDS